MNANLVKKVPCICGLLISFTAAAHMEDDPLLFMAVIDKLEVHDTAKPSLNWDAEAWVGRDLHKLWVKAEGEYTTDHIEAVEAQVLYNRAATPFWDFQIGLRLDSHNGLERDWMVIGLQGMSPYLFEIDTALFISEDGRAALRFETEYEIALTQRLTLSPEVELNFYGKDDRLRGIRAGLADVEAGLRLRYEIRPELAPYVGVNWEKLTGDTAALARFRGQPTEDSRFLIGIKAWF